ncbi:MAG: 16S rRNA (cytosine(967)-C(5))-methyltransferase RsmB [Deltaproteobacteria bacterium]|nr:16S rRNA (cytosine(967)-C(5))-methyltransferase RsmB [Deltaproteobacteria bacterium]
MQVNPARKIALNILIRIGLEDSFADILLANELEKGSLSQLDKSLTTELVYGVLRWRLKIDWIINQFSKIKTKKMEHTVLNAIRLGVYQLLFLTKIPASAAIDESVKLVKKSCTKKSGFINAVLRRIDAERKDIIFPNIKIEPIKYVSVVFSHPDWLIERWITRYDVAQTIKICQANNQIPPVVVRVNTLKTTRDDFLKRLADHGIDAEKTRYSPDGVIVGRGFYPQMEMLPQELFYIQDEASQMVSYLLAPKPGEGILDTCAAPGSKTTHMAQMLNNKGCIYAMDIHKSRLETISQTCKRLGINIVKTFLSDGTKDLQFVPQNGFDAVLIDAPCSGLGVLRRNPDAKWKKPDMNGLTRLQKGILENLSRYVKKGGRLIYSTCTTEPEENEEVIYGFLKAHTEFKLTNAKMFLSDTIVDENGFLRTSSHKHNMDGFFGARMERI